MNLILDQTKLLQSSLSGLMVILGVVLKNSSEQLKQQTSILGPLLFVCGWLLNSFSVSGKFPFNAGNRGIIAYVAALTIVLSVFVIKSSKKSPPTLAKFGFIGGWLLYAYAIAVNNNLSINMSRGLYSFLGAISVLISMMILLPNQRKLGIVDGFGMPLFTIGWVLISLGISLKLK